MSLDGTPDVSQIRFVDSDRYKDVRDEPSMASSLASGARGGAMGTVIPRHTRGGKPKGLNTEMDPNETVLIDPGTPSAATKTLQELLRQPAGLPTVHAGKPVARPARTTPMPVKQAATRAASGNGLSRFRMTSGAPAAAQAPVVGFSGTSTGVQQGPPSRFASAMPAAPVVKRPQFEVLFNIEGFGDFTAHYHDVLVVPGFLVLIYDQRFTDGMQWYPDANEMLINVTGHPEVYKAFKTGVKYEYDKKVHCVVMFNPDDVTMLEGDHGEESDNYAGFDPNA